MGAIPSASTGAARALTTVVSRTGSVDDSPTGRRATVRVNASHGLSEAMLIFLAWIVVLAILYSLKVPWWVWVVFVLGSFLVFIGG